MHMLLLHVLRRHISVKISLVFCTGLTAGAKADTVPAPVRTVTRKGTGTGEPRCVTGIVILPAGHEPRVCMYGVGSET